MHPINIHTTAVDTCSTAENSYVLSAILHNCTLWCSMNTLAFLSHARRWELVLWNLMLLSERLLSMWQLIQTCVVFIRSAQGVETQKNCLNAFSPVGSGTIASSICWSLVGVQRTKDGSSLSMVHSRWFIALVGLNFVGAIGVGKKARIARSKSHITKFFVANWVGVVVDAVGTVWLTWEGAAASEGTMVEWGGSVIDPRRLA